MKALVTALALLGAGGVWAWALTGAPPAAGLPEKYVGTYEMFRFAAGAVVGAVDPLAQGQSWKYTFRADGSYTIRVLVTADWEMMRRTGTIREDGADALVLARVAENGTPLDAPPERYYAQWGSDEEGPYLHLTEELATRAGQQLFLRRIAD